MYYNICTQIHTIQYIHASTHEMYLPYLSVLKSGSYTCRGSNIHWVVQQNERNKHLGSFKHQVPKLLNLIHLKMVLNIKENQLILDISLDACISLSDVATVDRL